jgi:hypothetical protein
MYYSKLEILIRYIFVFILVYYRYRVKHIGPIQLKFVPYQARSSLYANTQLRAHRRAEKKNKEQKKKKK